MTPNSFSSPLSFGRARGCSLWLPLLCWLVTVPLCQATVTFTTNTLIDTNNLAYEGQDIVVQGCIVTVNGRHAFNSVALSSGAVLTHQATSAAQQYSLILTISNNLVVDSTSSIDVSARGYLPGYTLGNTTNGAATFTAGGSYGGFGQLCCNSTGNAPYGDYHNPNELGSGSGVYSGGASGGGLLRVTAGSAQVDGAILANGGNGYDGGSGGGIFLSVGTLGGSGQINANGGSANGNDGGGGGRVAIYYATSTFNLSSNVTATAGQGPSGPGSVGTVYLKQTGGAGQLVINNHGVRTALWTPLGAATDTLFQVDVLLVSGTNVVAALQHQMVMDVGTVSVVNGGLLTHQPTTASQEYSLLLTVTNNLLVDSTASIDASARGYLPGYTFGNSTNGASIFTAGGSYGGLGGVCCNSTRNDTYGDYHNPNELGSGSGIYSGGAPGGGLVRITAGSAQVDGAILANGGNGYDSGSGGGVLLNIGALTGKGRITANGGNSFNGGNDGGGGGRVAIYYGSSTFDLSNSVTANAGYGPSQAGSVGTVFLQPSGGLGQLVISSHGTPVALWTPLGAATDTVVQVDTLLVSGTNVVAVPEHQMEMQVGSVSILNAGTLTHLPTTTNQEYSLLLTVSNSLVVDSISSIDVSGRGYLPDYTFGNTTKGGATYTAGGSYGGLGQLCCNATGNAVYGDYHNPNELGSGSGDYSGGASGGGLVRINAGSAQLDGAVLANGSNGYDAGSGGGIFLKVGTLSGAGQIAANGGNASGNDGGGGGRVAIYYTSSSFNLSNNVTATAGRGSSSGAGSVGTVYLQQTGSAGQLVISSHGTPAGQWTPLGVATDSVFQVDILLISGTNVVVAPEHQMLMQVGALAVLNACQLTHLPTTTNQEYSLLLTVTNNLLVDGASSIDVSALGFLPDYTLGNRTAGGATYTAGGSYGGLGGICCGAIGNPVYGDYHNPNELGSGSGDYSGGAPGGGLLRITAGTAQLDGAVLANGGNGYDGGSGGGIYLSVGTLTGAGQINANGGNATGNDSGGGGRVAIYYGTSSFNLANNVTADTGKAATALGSAGTVFLQQTGHPGQLVISSHGAPNGSYTVLGQSTDTVFTAESLVLSGAGTVAATASGAPIRVNNLSLVNGAMLTHLPTTSSQAYSLVLTVTSNLVVDGTSSVDVSGRGYLPGYTLGNTTTGAGTLTAGGSYGGSGGLCCNAAGNAVYGDFHNPNELGSGSGTYSGGASGGGLIRITAANAQVDGAILANGGNGYDGGSGGGLFLSVGALVGGGRITANGGNSIGGNDGGGGGRVAIYYGSSTFDFSNNVTADSGNGPTQPGSAGTVFLEPSTGFGQLILTSHGKPAGQWTPLGVATDGVFQVDSLLISGSNVVAAPQHQMALEVTDLSILNAGLLTHQVTTPAAEYSLLVTVTSNLVVDSSSSIDVSDLGYQPGYTFDNTTVGAATITAGGSYGGLGGLCCNATNNALYGDYHNPNELGSGSGTYSGGASGGGLVRVTASNAQLDGAILANGANGYDGGSGGGVLVNAGVLNGSGRITANGGSAVGNDGGGGGRVAVYTWKAMNLPLVNVLANGGHGPTSSGQTGTVYIASQPFLTFSHAPPFWHGIEQVSFSAMGVDPNAGDIAEVVVSANGVTYLDQDMPTSGTLDVNTLNLPDGYYTLSASIVGVSGNGLVHIAQRELVNNSVIWHEGPLTTNQTWASGTVNIVDQTVIIPSGVTVTISPGAIVKFAKDAGITVQAGGTLNTLGTSSQSIVFTSLADDTVGGDSNLDGSQTQPHPGDWAGVAVLGGQFNANAFLDIRYSENTIGGTLATSQSWLGNAVYVVSNTVVVPTGITLTINPGAVIKFVSGAGVNVQSGGTLNSLGTAAQPITFTSFMDDSVGGDSDNDAGATNAAPGDWVGFNIAGQAFFSHSDIRFGGNTGSGGFASGVIIVNTGSLAISNSVVENALYDGLSIYGNNGNGLVLNCVLRNLDRAIWAWGGGNVRLVNCTFDQNVVGLDNHGGGIIDAENCIIANSIQASQIEGTVTARYCDAWSSYTNSSNPIPIGQNGNISANPRFVDPLQGDYRLNYLSPCIDAADGTKAPQTDSAGDARYNDPRTLVKTGVADTSGHYPDIGAFEFVESAPSKVDLIAGSILGPDLVQAGQSVTVQWVDSNRGIGNALGPWHDSLSLVSISDTNVILAAAEILAAQGIVLGPGQSCTNQAIFSVPGGTAGKYLWQVQVNNRGDVFEGANWSNNIAFGDSPTTLTVPLLSLGGTLATNVFTSVNSPVFFSLLPQPGQDIQINLNLLTGTGAVNLYVGQGYMPDPQHFDFRQTQWNSSSVSALLPSASTQPYYILVVPASLSTTPALFTISGSALSFQLTGVSPTVVGNGGTSTLQIQGSQLTSAMTYQIIDPSNNAHSAINVTLINSSEVAATFDFTGLPIGTYGLKIAGTAASLPGAFRVTATPPANLTLQITGPRYARVGTVSTLLVDYANPGGSDAVAPVLFLQANNGQFRLPGRTAWSAGRFNLFAGAVEGIRAGVLPAGARGEIAVEFSQPVPLSGSSFYSVSLADPSALLDWASLYTTLKPQFQPADSWTVIFSNLVAKVGSTYGQLQAALARDATYLSMAGEGTLDPGRLLAFEFQQADNFGTITRRYLLGAFGRGVVDPTDVSALSDASGNILVRAFNNFRFFRLQPDGSYIGQPGDFGTLTKNGVLQLREKNGKLTSFRTTDGKIDYTQDKNGNRTTANYTGGLLTSFSDSFGNSTTFSYNAAGRIIQVTDPVGRITSYTYDSSGEHLVAVSNLLGTLGLSWITGKGPAVEHAPASITFRNGTHLFYQYDSNGRVTKQSLDGGAQPITYSYDSLGALTATDASGAVVTVRPNDAFRIVEIDDGFGTVTKASYDSSEDLTGLRNNFGQAASWQYDSHGNVLSGIDSLGNQIALTYNQAFSEPDSVADALGHRVTVVYDAHGNIASENYPEATFDGYQHDAVGNTVAWTNRRGHTTRYSFNSHNSLTGRTLSDGSSQSFVYDSHRNLTSVTDATGTTSFSYDAADRLTHVSQPGGRSLDFTYDSAGRRSKSVDQSGFTTIYTYDANGRLGGISDVNSNKVASYTYDTAGRLAQIDYGNGTSLKYSLGLPGQVQNIALQHSGTALANWSYTYDGLGQILAGTNSAGSFSYGYDDAGHLTSATVPGGRVVTYQYDANGNRSLVNDTGTNINYSVNSLNEYEGAGSTVFTYDADGNLVSKTDATGTTTFAYDDLNYLLSITSPAGTWSYVYNALGQRVAVINNGQRTDYLLDPVGLGYIVGEYTGGALKAHYTYGLSLASRVDASGTADYYVFDPSGNTVGLTDPNGNLANSYAYLPFGEKLSAAGLSGNPFTFGGKNGILDDASGFYSMRARVYAPDLGRFLSTDPGDILAPNLYTYANNNPVSFFDPTGRAPKRNGTSDDDLNNALNNWQNSANAVNNSLNGPGTPSDTTSTAVGVATTAATAGDSNVATAGGVGVTAIGGTQALATGIVLFGGEKQALDAIQNLPELGGSNPNGGSASGSTTQVQSSDPNNKVGVGFGTQGFVTGDGNLFYTVDFANETNATAPAQKVVVTDHLDSNLDWSSFELQTIAFNNVNLTVPPGLQNYSNQVQVSTDPNPVQVLVSFNPSSGLITWQMQSIDPVTQALVSDPFAGFLPPDNAQGAGEGYATYVVRPRAGLSTGVAVVNQANIVFDVNAPILTPVVTNTIDHTPPISAMTPLPATTPLTNLVVSWSGTDVGSGIAGFDIYVSVNNGPWTLWLSDTPTTSGVYPAAYGNSYAFYSAAIDAAGNVETSPKIPGTKTTVQLSQAPLLSAPSLGNGQLQFSVLATAGNHYAIQTSTNLNNWVSVATNVSPFVYTDPNYRNSSLRWYRAVLVP